MDLIALAALVSNHWPWWFLFLGIYGSTTVTFCASCCGGCSTAVFGDSFTLDLSGILQCLCTEGFANVEWRNVTFPTSWLFISDAPGSWVAAPNGSADLWVSTGLDCTGDFEFSDSGTFRGFATCHTDGLQLYIEWTSDTPGTFYRAFGATFTALGQSQPNGLTSCGLVFSVIGTGSI